MKYFQIILLVALSYSVALGQYNFETVEEAGCTAIKDQANTGTCWSFATCSFLESELIRIDKGSLDLSEMFIVRNIYKDKAYNYVMRQGKANFGQGSLSHDFTKTVARHGIVPEDIYSGLINGQKRHNHSALVSELKGLLDSLVKLRRVPAGWEASVDKILTRHIGSYPESFTYNGKTYSPKSFAMSLGLNPRNYISLTSYTHYPFYEKFVLEIPDNFSNESYFNIPMEELEAIVDNAIKQGYTVAWDGDVSEKGFSQRHGLAVIPADPSRQDVFTTPGKEVEVTQKLRQETFESYATTDDHLMHIVGIVKDQKGEKYYKIKNSWGATGKFSGYLYMSAPYFRLKTVGIMVNKASVPDTIAKKLTL